MATIPCTSCHSELDHCHGVLVTHADGALDCRADRPCDALEPHRHEWRTTCAEVDDRCECGWAAAA